MGTGSHISRTCLESQLYFWNDLTGSNFFRKFNETLQGQFSLSLFLVLTSPPCSFPAPIAEAWLWGVCDLATFLQGFERNPLRSEDTGLEGCPETPPRGRCCLPNLWPWAQLCRHKPLLCVCSVAQPCLTLCGPKHCIPPGSTACGILQARILEHGAISSSRGSFRPRDQTHVSCIGRWLLYH